MNYKKYIDEILNSNSDYLNILSKKILIELENDEIGFFSFCLEYLPYSISEELILLNHRIILNLTQENWTSIIQNMHVNPIYGKETLRFFFKFHTSLNDEKIEELGLNRVNKVVDNEEEMSDDHQVLTKNHPRVLRKYYSLGLDANAIREIHEFTFFRRK